MAAPRASAPSSSSSPKPRRDLLRIEVERLIQQPWGLPAGQGQPPAAPAMKGERRKARDRLIEDLENAARLAEAFVRRISMMGG